MSTSAPRGRRFDTPEKATEAMMWPDGEVKLLSDQVLDSVDVAEACGGHANLEPRFTDAPWKMALFTQAITQTRKIGPCWTFSTTTECLVACYWKSVDFERTTARELFTVDSACNGELTNNGFAFVAKNATCTEANYSYTCLATKGTCKASLSSLMEVSLATCMEVPESCSAGVDEMREMASTIKTEVLA